MKYYISLITNKQMGSNVIKKTRIQSPITPTEEQFKEWKRGTVLAAINKQPVLPIFIEYNREDFIKIVQRLYRKVGKSVSLHEEGSNLYRIPTKQGAFFEEIDHIPLYNDVYQNNIAVIKIKF